MNINSKNLKNFPFLIKFSYTLYFLFVIMGFVFAGIIIEIKIGRTPYEILSYYKGNEEILRYRKSLLELAETAHFHSFISSAILLLLSLFFSFTSISKTKKIITVLSAFTGIFMLVIGPFLYTYGSSFFIFLKYIGSFLMLFSIIYMGYRTLKEMWFS